MSSLLDRHGRRILGKLSDLAGSDIRHPISARQIPIALHRFPDVAGVSLRFPPEGESVPSEPPGDPPAADHPMVGDVLVRVPYLPGMDELEVQRAHFTIATESDPFSYASSDHSAGAAGTVRLPDGVTGVLTRVVLHDLRPSVSGSERLVFADTHDGGKYITWAYDAESGQVVATRSAGPPGGTYLHAVLQASGQDGSGPPLVAAPHFAMPGHQPSLYGPALGGMKARLVLHVDGRVDLTLLVDPPLPIGGFQVVIGAGEGSAHAGLPNEMAPRGWTAEEVTGRWQRRPSGLVIHALTGPAAGNEDAPAVVATLGQEVDHGGREIDFTPAARSLLRAHYANAGGPDREDLELRLRVSAGSPGRVRVRPERIGARYLRALGMPDGQAVSLRGAPETLALPGVPPGLRPQAFSFAVDGGFGPAVLVAGADEPLPPDTRTGFRLAGPVWLARRMSLTGAERGRRLVRAGIFGRASSDAEVLVGLHQGDALRVGAARGPTVSLAVAASARPGWHRVELPVELGLGPHPEALWVVVQVTRGVFWWYGALEEGTPLLRSDDAGGTWSRVTGRPGLQLHVEHVDESTRQPLPNDPVRLLRGGPNASDLLAADLAAIDVLGPPGELRRHWVLDRRSDAAGALDAFASLPGGILSLVFSCRRDVELRVRDVLVTYDPWDARSSS